MIIITSHFFKISDRISFFGYKGTTYRTGETVEIEEKDLEHIPDTWLIKELPENPAKEVIEISIPVEPSKETISLPTTSEPKDESKRRGRKRTTE